jgi:protein-disulfide isomerase
MPEDNLRAELVRAIALELMRLGYRPSVQHAYLQRGDDEPLRLVAEDVWGAVNAILVERACQAGARAHPLFRPDEATDHIMGPAQARVTLIEYGDFECPSCRQAHGALEVMLPHFGAQVRLVFRHFPLDEHPHAALAAEAAETAGAQGRFWQMHHQLLEHQLHLDERQVLDCASRAGLDVPRYRQEMGDRLYRSRVQEHVKGARHLGVRSTPAFFVNGAFADVSFGLHHLHEAIDRALLAA